VIFVTVGHQTPFDRLIRAMDSWAAEHREKCFAQIGNGSYTPRHMEHVRFLPPSDFSGQMMRARLVVGHAGIGSIVESIESGRQLVALPRRADLRETRNDHQQATAEMFKNRPGIFIAGSESELPATIDLAMKTPAPEAHPVEASPQLIARVASFIRERS
jgi:UDP-N-acetylglucosamine transferase subunit ALG13